MRPPPAFLKFISFNLRIESLVIERTDGLCVESDGVQGFNLRIESLVIESLFSDYLSLAEIRFNLRIESLVIESPYLPREVSHGMPVSISELRVLLLRADSADRGQRSIYVSISELRVLLLRAGWEPDPASHGDDVSISELRVLLLRVHRSRALASTITCFNLRIESLVIERSNWQLLQYSKSLFQSQN